MKYRIDWRDSRKAEKQTLTVHTAKGCADATRALGQDYHVTDVRVTNIQPARIREYIITFERYRRG